MATPQTALNAPGWHGSLDLGFARGACMTRIVRRRHRGPLYVQQPFYPEGAPCHVCVLHPPGGMVAGDTLALALDVGPHAHALITTPAASKYYRSAGAQARVSQDFKVADGAVLEWLPQEAIVFETARVVSRYRVELADTAVFIGWDLVCLGRRAQGERFESGHFVQTWSIRRSQRLLWRERTEYLGGDVALSAAFGLKGYGVVATLVATVDRAPIAAAVPKLQELCRTRQGMQAAVTVLDGVLVCRGLGDHTEVLRNFLIEAWHILRPVTVGRPACVPRIWQT